MLRVKKDWRIGDLVKAKESIVGTPILKGHILKIVYVKTGGLLVKLHNHPITEYFYIDNSLCKSYK